jgi:hypothetical protein
VATATSARPGPTCNRMLELGPDGLITEERDYFDAAALFGQLGIAG